MEDNSNIFESLLKSTAEYGIASLELLKMKTLDKTSNVISSFMPHVVVYVIIGSFMLFANLGLALWLGEILGKIYFGFLAVAAFYGFIALLIQLFFRKLLKKMFCNYIIKQVLK